MQHTFTHATYAGATYIPLSEDMSYEGIRGPGIVMVKDGKAQLVKMDDLPISS